jgi:hypothetical protein
VVARKVEQKVRTEEREERSKGRKMALECFVEALIFEAEERESVREARMSKVLGRRREREWAVW